METKEEVVEEVKTIQLRGKELNDTIGWHLASIMSALHFVSDPDNAIHQCVVALSNEGMDIAEERSLPN